MTFRYPYLAASQPLRKMPGTMPTLLALLEMRELTVDGLYFTVHLLQCRLPWTSELPPKLWTVVLTILIRKGGVRKEA